MKQFAILYYQLE